MSGDSEVLAAQVVADDESGLTGAQLLERWSKEELLDRWMQQYGKAIYGVCLVIVGDPALAQDVVQNALIAATEGVAKFAGRSSVRNWLMKIATHDARDARRAADRRARRFVAEERGAIVAAGGESPVAQLEFEQLMTALRECLSELSPETRDALLLRYGAELSYDQMEKELDAKADTLCQRIRRALPVLRRCLEQKGWATQ